MTIDFKPYTPEEFLEVAPEVITGQLGKDPHLARYVAERVVLRIKDGRQAIQVATYVPVGKRWTGLREAADLSEAKSPGSDRLR